MLVSEYIHTLRLTQIFVIYRSTVPEFLILWFQSVSLFFSINHLCHYYTVTYFWFLCLHWQVLKLQINFHPLSSTRPHSLLWCLFTFSARPILSCSSVYEVQDYSSILISSAKDISFQFCNWQSLILFAFLFLHNLQCTQLPIPIEYSVLDYWLS